LLFASIIVLIVFPFFVKPKIISGSFRPLFQLFFWLFVSDFVILEWIGGQPIEDPYYLIGQIATVYYFSYFLIILPLLIFFENKLYKLN
jgi:ubiquinol-cytochrome c reductase cytochrome b subunit